MARITIPIVSNDTQSLRYSHNPLSYDLDYVCSDYYETIVSKLDEAIRRQTYLILNYGDVSPTFIDDVAPRKIFTYLTRKYGRDTLDRYLMIVPPEYVPIPGVNVDLMKVICDSIDDAEFERRKKVYPRLSFSQRLKRAYQALRF